MSDAVKIELSEQAQGIIRRLGATDWLMGAVAKEMDLQNQLAIAHISTVRMRGNDWKPFPPEQHVLGIRSGTLYRSLRNAAAVVSGSTVDSSIGTNIRYAGVHEFGFDGEVTVTPHSRRRFEVQKFMGLGKRKVQRKVRKADTFVGAFKRTMHIPARAPIRSGVEDCIPAYGTAISAAIVDAWNKTQSA